MFPDVHIELSVFQFVPTASGPITGHHWEDSGSIYFVLSGQVAKDTDKIPLSLLLTKQSAHPAHTIMTSL